jgi:hypothetical protein
MAATLRLTGAAYPSPSLDVSCAELVDLWVVEPFLLFTLSESVTHFALIRSELSGRCGLPMPAAMASFT